MQPWMSNEEIKLIEKHLNKNQTALEWGSGGSTVHFSKLVREWHSIEHNRDWYEKVVKSKPDNVQIHFVGSDHRMAGSSPSSILEKESRWGVASRWPLNENFMVYSNYAKELNKKFDVVLVDGRSRKWCALNVIPYIKKDSIVFVHDFWMREDRNYFDVFEYFDIVDKIKHGQSIVALKLKSDIHPAQFCNYDIKKNHRITTTISCNNNLDYLKLAIKSVRENCYFYDMPFIVHAENCNDGTDEWLEENKDKYDLKIYIDHNDKPKGIGGGMNFCVDKVKTEFVNIIHADMWCAPNQDLELLKLYDDIDKDTKLIASSFRIQPKIFPQDPDYRPGTVFHTVDEFGEYYHNFDSDYFNKWAIQFSNDNDIVVRKGGGAGFFCRVEDYKSIGGNDSLFAPASWEDMDLFIRMQLEGYEFKMITKSVLWHFGARGSHFRDEAKDDFTKKSERQQKAEQVNMQKWISKWGRLPDHDSETFVVPIMETKVPTRLKWESFDETD